MDIYTYVSNLATEHAGWSGWPDFQRQVERAIAPHPSHWRLPEVACRAAGGDPQAALAPATGLAYLQIAIMLIDDLLDDDPRGEHLRIGAGAAANLASAFQSAGLQCVLDSGLPPETRLAIAGALNRMLGETALGQHLDAQNARDEAGYWRAVQIKSGPFFAAALHVGALAGGAAAQAARQLAGLGQVYGEIVQLHDDLSDCMAIPASPDWHTGRQPLPFLFAEQVDHTERQRFLALRQHVCDSAAGPAALEEAQAILVRCGAIAYCVYHIQERYRQAVEALQSIPLAEPALIAQLLDEMIEPINSLLVLV